MNKQAQALRNCKAQFEQAKKQLEQEQKFSDSFKQKLDFNQSKLTEHTNKQRKVNSGQNSLSTLFTNKQKEDKKVFFYEAEVKHNQGKLSTAQVNVENYTALCIQREVCF